jgi:hypothetical protein
MSTKKLKQLVEIVRNLPDPYPEYRPAGKDAK